MPAACICRRLSCTPGSTDSAPQSAWPLPSRQGLSDALHPSPRLCRCAWLHLCFALPHARHCRLSKPAFSSQSPLQHAGTARHEPQKAAVGMLRLLRSSMHGQSLRVLLQAIRAGLAVASLERDRRQELQESRALPLRLEGRISLSQMQA